MYCFLNHEVQELLKKRWRQYWVRKMGVHYPGSRWATGSRGGSYYQHRKNTFSTIVLPATFTFNRTSSMNQHTGTSRASYDPHSQTQSFTLSRNVTPYKNSYGRKSPSPYRSTTNYYDISETKAVPSSRRLSRHTELSYGSRTSHNSDGSTDAPEEQFNEYLHPNDTLRVHTSYRNTRQSKAESKFRSEDVRVKNVNESACATSPTSEEMNIELVNMQCCMQTICSNESCKATPCNLSSCMFSENYKASCCTEGPWKNCCQQSNSKKEIELGNFSQIHKKDDKLSKAIRQTTL